MKKIDDEFDEAEFYRTHPNCPNEPPSCFTCGGFYPRLSDEDLKIHKGHLGCAWGNCDKDLPQNHCRVLWDGNPENFKANYKLN